MTPESYTIDGHFAGRDPGHRTAFDRVMEVLTGFGNAAAEPKKTCLHLVRRTALGGIHFRKDCLLLEFKSAGPIDDPAIAKSEQISANRWHHTVRLTTPSDVTASVTAWLGAAWEMSE